MFSIRKPEGNLVVWFCALDIERIEVLKKGIPSIDIYTEYTGEKPIPDTTPNPIHALPSYSEMDWTIGKLMKKAEKILRK